MDGEVVKVVHSSGCPPTTGTAGLRCHAPSATTVSSVSALTGGTSKGKFIETDIK